jgi:hypothetical protein
MAFIKMIDSGANESDLAMKDLNLEKGYSNSVKRFSIVN